MRSILLTECAYSPLERAVYGEPVGWGLNGVIPSSESPQGALPLWLNPRVAAVDTG